MSKWSKFRRWAFLFSGLSILASTTAYAGFCIVGPSGEILECVCEAELECALMKQGCDREGSRFICYASGPGGGCAAGKCIKVEPISDVPGVAKARGR